MFQNAQVQERLTALRGISFDMDDTGLDLWADSMGPLVTAMLAGESEFNKVFADVVQNYVVVARRLDWVDAERGSAVVERLNGLLV